MSEPQHFTGRTRRLQTRPAVKWGDKLARLIITIGGLGTIVSVLLICVFLVWEVLPLFQQPQLAEQTSEQLTFQSSTAAELKNASPDKNFTPPKILQLEEDGLLGWQLNSDLQLIVMRTDTGQVLQLLEPAAHPLSRATAWRLLTKSTGSIKSPYTELLFGNDQGEIQTGRIRVLTETNFITEQIPATATGIEPGATPVTIANKLWSRTPQGLLKAQSIQIQWDQRYQLESSTGAVKFVDFILTTPSGTSKKQEYLLAVVTADGKCQLLSAKQQKSTTAPFEFQLAVNQLSTIDLQQKKSDSPRFVLMSGLGEYLNCIWSDGTLHRYEIRKPEQPLLIEQTNLLTSLQPSDKDKPNGQVTAVEMLEGRTTLLVGDSQGHVNAWFPINKPGESGSKMVAGHQFKNWSQAITQIVPLQGNRSFLAIDQAGKSQLLFVTNERFLGEIPPAQNEQIQSAAVSANQQRILTVSNQRYRVWNYNSEHADVSLKNLFMPVWYEGDLQPAWRWDDHALEPRYSLVPLIFGTLKATFYSMLFGAPIALLAALFASEFLHPNVKSRIKPVIELMASLPSVVLGFVAGMIFAPLLQTILPQSISAIFFVPISLLLGSYLWQLLPQRITLQAGAWRLLAIGISMLPGIGLAMLLGQRIETLLFGKSIQSWLTEDLAVVDTKSSAWGGWFLLLLPLATLLVWWLVGRLTDDWLRAMTKNASRSQATGWSLLNYLALLLLTAIVAAGMAYVLTLFGYDPRNPESGERYTRSNSLLVGITMGFAIIPLIFTIADDALSTVPNHLRSASLGAGATPWQTATRIVIPTALSGLFSAIMIGLGRAVGETMIVLMTVGNTPIMEFNMFNGFQTLSAAIAKGLTEASQGSSQYRVLFLAALTLFILTFTINTVAEKVRQRFRRRAYEL